MLVNMDKKKGKRLLVAIGKGKSLSEQLKVSVWSAFSTRYPPGFPSIFGLEFPAKVFTKTPARISVKIPAVISRQDSR